MAIPQQPLEVSKELKISTSITVKTNAKPKKDNTKTGKQPQSKPPPPKETFAEK